MSDDVPKTAEEKGQRSHKGPALLSKLLNRLGGDDGKRG